MRQCAVAGGGVPLPLLRAGRPHAGLKGRLCPPSHKQARADCRFVVTETERLFVTDLES